MTYLILKGPSIGRFGGLMGAEFFSNACAQSVQRGAEWADSFALCSRNVPTGWIGSRNRELAEIRFTSECQELRVFEN